MARLPQPGADDGTWGNILNEYLQTSLNADGTIKPEATPVSSVAGRTGAVTLVEGDISNLTADLASKVTVTAGGGETYFDVGSSGTATTLNLANGNVQKLTLTGNCTLTLGAPAAGAMRSLTLLVFQDGTGARTIAWPAAVKWGNPGVPVLSVAAGKMDMISLFTVDGGTTWYGIAGVQGF